MHNKLRAVVAGHICLDIIPEMNTPVGSSFRDTFQPGHLIVVGNAMMSTGGAVSNTGLALHRLGISTQLIGKVGDDPFGIILRELVESFGPGLSSGMVIDPNSSTSYSLIISPPGVDRIFLHNPAANHTFNADDIDYEMVSQAALFHFGYPPIMRGMYEEHGRGLIEMFQRVKQTGVTTSLDMCYPDPTTEGGQADWKSILENTLPNVDIFLPSLEELALMLRPTEFDEMRRGGRVLDQVTPAYLHDLSGELLSMGVPVAVIKLGERGIYLRTAQECALGKMGRAAPVNPASWAEKELWAPCFRVQVVGTTGSGDATIVGFLSALLRGLGPEETITASVAVGACNVEAADALSGLRSWEDTLQRIQSGWERLPLQLDDPAWMWDHSNGLWRNTH